MEPIQISEINSVPARLAGPRRNSSEDQDRGRSSRESVSHQISSPTPLLIKFARTTVEFVRCSSRRLSAAESPSVDLSAYASTWTKNGDCAVVPARAHLRLFESAIYRLHAHVDRLRVADRCQTPPRSQQRSVSQGIRMLRRPDQDASMCHGYDPGCFSACSILVSVDLIQLCCCEAVSRSWLQVLLSLDWYQHRGILVLH
jgi:hypothetical protein